MTATSRPNPAPVNPLAEGVPTSTMYAAPGLIVATAITEATATVAQPARKPTSRIERWDGDTRACAASAEAKKTNTSKYK